MTTPTGGLTDGNSPSLNVIAQYIKDLSFENPSAPGFAPQLENPPALKVQIDVTAKPLSETEFEVELTIEGKAEFAQKTLFAIDLVYAGVFRVQNMPKENVHALILIECPRLLFPFAREIIANVVRNGGFPPLLLDPVDFITLYKQRIGQQSQQ